MTRITKREAFKRFVMGELFVICPCKLTPDGPFSSGCRINGKDYIAGPEYSAALAWDRMYDNWLYYNASFEAGYYAHFYLPS
jgi:hypothetical protein